MQTRGAARTRCHRALRVATWRLPPRSARRRPSAPRLPRSAPGNSSATARRAGRTTWPVFRGDALATALPQHACPTNRRCSGIDRSRMGLRSHAGRSPRAWSMSAGWTELLRASIWPTGKRNGSSHRARLQRPAAVRDGRVYVGDTDGKFYCLDAANGKTCGASKPTPKSTPAPTSIKDTVLFGSQDATLYCLNADDRQAGLEVCDRRTDPVLANGRRRPGVRRRLRRQAAHHRPGRRANAVGKRRHRSPRPAPRRRCAATSVYFGTEGGTFFAIDWKRPRSTGVQSQSASSRIRSSAAVTARAGRSSAAATAGACPGATTGTSCGISHPWRESTLRRSSSAIACSSAPADGRIYGLDLHTGEKVWEYEAGGGFTASPAVADGRLVIANDDGTYIALAANRARQCPAEKRNASTTPLHESIRFTPAPQRQ